MKGNELKPHIGIFGRRNYGKSSLVNYLTGQHTAIVSDTPGTTTDPVKKTMEIGGIGPVVWIDTAGIDDEGSVGRLRIERSLQMLAQADLALILFTNNRFDAEEVMLVEECRKRGIAYLLVYSQADRLPPDPALLQQIGEDYGTEVFVLTVHDPTLRQPLTDRIRATLPTTAYRHPSLLGDVVSQGDTVVLVTPIDSSAPEGRMILPQVQVLRDLMDLHAQALFCQPQELASTLAQLRQPPRLVITDSQAFGPVSAVVPEEVYLTSFSIVLARQKGLFDHYLQGTPTIGQLRDGDRVLLLESCTHNVTCEDIGRVKLPAALRRATGKELLFDIVAGHDGMPAELNRAEIGSEERIRWALVIQCGGCVITAQQVRARLQPALDAGIPVSNYGLALAWCQGIFPRATRIFSDTKAATPPPALR